MKFAAGKAVLFAACFAGACTTARAAIVSGLYEASVPVPDQSAAAQRVALEQALAAVLVKVTGERSAGGVPALAALIQDPGRFLQQYRYTQSPAGGLAQPLTYYDLTRVGTPVIPPTGLMLWAKFDPAVVDSAVRAAHEPLWGKERPATLVWLVIQHGTAQTVLKASDSDAVMQALTSAAGQRGVPLIFPLMDARDQQAIGIPDLLNDIDEAISRASQRYRPDAVLVGDLYATVAGQYAARWQLSAGGTVQSWNTPPADLDTVAAAGVQWLADNYARRYAIPASATGTSGVTVQVDGIDDVSAYARVLAFLETLTPVKSVQVLRVARGTVFFGVDARGNFDNLVQAITLGDLLQPLAVPAPTAASGATPGAGGAVLRFRYAP